MTIGYDTVYLWLPAEEVKGGIPENTVLEALEDVEHRVRQNSDELYSVGTMKGLHVAVFKSGVSVKGSIGKFYAQANYELLHCNEAGNCMAYLSELLGIPMEKAKVTRMDIACDFVVKHPPKTYYSFLGQAGRMEREQIGGGLYYNVKVRQLLFYDKIKEMKADVPIALKGKHVMRIELRLKQRLPKQLNINKVIGATLADPNLFSQLFNLLVSSYDSIVKEREVVQSAKAHTSPEDYYNNLILTGLMAKGGIDKTLQEMANQQRENGWCRRKTDRYRKKILDLAQNPYLTNRNKQVEELDSLIRQAVVEQEEMLLKTQKKTRKG